MEIDDRDVRLTLLQSPVGQRHKDKQKKTSPSLANEGKQNKRKERSPTLTNQGQPSKRATMTQVPEAQQRTLAQVAGQDKEPANVQALSRDQVTGWEIARRKKNKKEKKKEEKKK